MIKGTSPVVNDHRCGACHNTSDAKVRIELLNKYGIIKNAQLSLFLRSYIFHTFSWPCGGLYIPCPGF